MRDRIYITQDDCDRLQRMIDGLQGTGRLDQASLDMLEQELDRAERVEAARIPRDVITMNSVFRVKDLDSGSVHTYRLVFPTQSGPEGCVSVLAPLGMAMLGYRTGAVVQWRMPKGPRRLKVLEVLHQPEHAGAAAD